MTYSIYLICVSVRKDLIMKIAVMGFSGSGKSTLAKQLAGHYGIPLLYLDTVNFSENWQLRDREEGRRLVAHFMKNESWVIDGNYSEFYQFERLSQADIIIILCFNRFVCMKQAFGRYAAYKGRVRESMSSGCTERMDPQFFLALIYKQYSKARKAEFASIKAKYPDKTHLFKSKKQLKAFLLALEQAK